MRGAGETGTATRMTATGRGNPPAAGLLLAALAALAGLTGCSDPWGPDIAVTVTQPPSGGIQTDESTIIEWTLSEDPTDEQRITLFVDTDRNPETGLIQIADSLSAETTGFLWDCTLFPEDDYYVRAVLHDGGWSTEDYSEGAVSVAHGNGLREHRTPAGLPSL
jgi:hypothetical protein